MTRIDPELERTVRSWLDDGVNTLPDHVFDAVVGQMPATRQRRLAWWPPDRDALPLLTAAAAVLVLAVTLLGLLLGTNVGDEEEPDATWRRLPSVAEALLDAGRYLIDEPFPVRIGLTVPDGWKANPIRSTLAQIGHESGDAGLTFTVVDGVYADPCHNDAGLLVPPVGPTSDELAAALAGLPGVVVTGPSDTTVDGVPAVTMTLTAPAVMEGCTAEPQSSLFKIWGVPEGHWLEPGERNRLWIVAVGDTRLVISSEELEGSTPLALAELNAIVSSIDLDPVVESVADASEAPAPATLRLPASGPLVSGTYEFEIQLHRFAGAVPIPLAGRHRIETSVEEGWSSAGNGVELPGAGHPTVGIAAWSIARIYADPCHWQAEEPGLVDPEELRTLDGLAAALSGWWAMEPPRPGFDPAPAAPLATEPMDVPRYGRFGRYVELTVPPEIDLEACDGGEYRLWEDSAGRPRSARLAGERIGLHIVDADPGLVVVEAWTLPSASEADREALEIGLYGIWLRDPASAAGE